MNKAESIKESLVREISRTKEDIEWYKSRAREAYYDMDKYMGENYDEMIKEKEIRLHVLIEIMRENFGVQRNKRTNKDKGWFRR